ncbi:MAG TPA: alcohol dehydrogenase catalytic domain-containing protein [Gaiellaceae bacterium]|jgi:L-iditol 2-dehydrogenase|nr:alcohol dehydrogenase catalytic domain-containing protein [Gaiellaceae bacterium]
MRAVVLDSAGEPELADVPEPGGAGLLVRVAACGLCGSDVEKLGRWPAGSVLGHEIDGELEDGSRVTAMHRVPCGACERCRAGHQSTCGEFQAVRIEPGGFAEYLRATHCVPLPPGLDALAGIWVEPLACVLRARELVPRGRVLVVGAGAVGQLWIQALVARGDTVVAADLRDERLRSARELGAVVDEDPVGAAVLAAHGGLNEALARLEPGGTLVVFASPPGLVETGLDAVYRKELTLVGSRSGTPAFFRDAVELLPSLRLPETAVYPLERFREGLDAYRRGDALKVAFVP